MEQLKNYVNEAYDELNQDVWDLVTPMLELVTYPKKTPLVKFGEIEKNIYFIKSGSMRFFIPQEENELTFGFAFEDEFVSAYDSFLNQEPCEYQLETITETTVWVLSKENLLTLYAETSLGNYIGRLIAENLFMKKKDREMSLLTRTAEQRYDDLFTSHPQIIKEIPLKYISSFIGITPQALSRIRARIGA